MNERFRTRLRLGEYGSAQRTRTAGSAHKLSHAPSVGAAAGGGLSSSMAAARLNPSRRTVSSPIVIQAPLRSPRQMQQQQHQQQRMWASTSTAASRQQRVDVFEEFAEGERRSEAERAVHDAANARATWMADLRGREREAASVSTHQQLFPLQQQPQQQQQQQASPVMPPRKARRPAPVAQVTLTFNESPLSDEDGADDFT